MAATPVAKPLSEHQIVQDDENAENDILSGGGNSSDFATRQGSKAEGVKTGEQLRPENEKPKDPSKIGAIWGKLDLDLGTVLMMFKASLPPTIGVAFYFSDSVAATFSTLGYLIPIISVLSMCIMPRAKYIQTLVFNVIGICIGSAVSLLGIWSGIQARKHTTPPGSTARYNSSQAAVCAIWLFANIWFANTLRAKIPALQFPVIMYSIFTNVSFTYGPLFTTVSAGQELIKSLLEGFLTAFAIATGVSLFIIPVSSRTVVFKEQAGYLSLVRACLKQQTIYLQSLETSDMFTKNGESEEAQDPKNLKKTKTKKKSKSHPAQNQQGEALKATLDSLKALHGKLYGDMAFGKREVAWGKLDAKDIDEIFTLFRGILIPLIGMSTITDIFERIAERRGWIEVLNTKFDKAESWETRGPEAKAKEKETWNEIMKTLHTPFAVLTAAMDEGLQHAGLVLELIPTPKAKQEEVDVEAKGDTPKPGDENFSKYLEEKVLAFYKGRGETLRAWARQKGLSEDRFNAGHESSQVPTTPDEQQHRRDQQQLYLILYLEHLLYSTGVAVSNLIKFADKKAAEGVMKKNRLILPGKRRLVKWIKNIGQEDSTIDTETPDSLEAGAHTIYLGAGYNPQKDPEHLPPNTTWQYFGNHIRAIPHFLGSTEASFGFRVACATLSIGIVAFLKDTQVFFTEQRLVWAMIIIAIGMTMTSGQSIFGFFGRIAGTALSMVLSLVIWYIVDQKTPGIIVMLWFFIFLEMYFFLKFPRFIAIWLICIVTQVLIIGYELQVRKIGIQASSASGQPYYPIYELGPYRLACVASGSAVAFFWTIFPYPLTDRSWLRRDLGSTLYLLSNYYNAVHFTIRTRLHNTEGDMSLKNSPGKSLQKARHKIFGKLMLLLPSVKAHADWQKWELTVGGKFPRETYDAITLRATNIMNYLSLMTYATESWSSSHDLDSTNSQTTDRRKWIDDLTVLIDSIGPTSHAVTSILCLLSASVKQGSALPPYLQIPQPYDLNSKLEALDRGILDVRHVEEPGYSAYAVLQVCSSLVMDDLRRLVDHVRDLVGETDFSFKISDQSSSSVDSGATVDNGGIGNGKGKRD